MVRNTPGNEIEMVGSGTSYSLQDTEASRVNQILSSNGHSCLRSTCVRMYHKATVNGKVFFSKGYKRVTKRNSYTIMYLNLSMGTVQYGIIEKFIYADGHYLASIQEIMIVSKGPPQEFSESITANSRKLLFSDYSTFKYGDSNYIFVSQILEKCCNLSNGDWNVLTLPVNDVEVE